MEGIMGRKGENTMGTIFYLIGKSASGKDRMFRALRERFGAALLPVVMYTTRPIRSGEEEGVTYHYVGTEQLEAFRAAGRLIESRTYHTVHGLWTYATVDDGQIDLQRQSYLMEGTLESFAGARSYYGDDKVMPLYMEVENGERLARALGRERGEAHPKYAEMCRRFLADEEDFSEEKLTAAGIVRRYINDDFERCLEEIASVIAKGAAPAAEPVPSMESSGKAQA